ncbi:MAG: TetR/AcrR family transcriptional regulator [Pseudomonadota bacterium]
MISRRDRQKITQRMEMLAAALELFSQKGYHNVSMHEIAAKSEFAIGTLYKFFSNKEDLYKALVLELSDRFHAALSKAIETPGDEIDKLRRYVQSKGEVFRDKAATIRLYFAETRGASFNILAGLDQDIRNRRERFLEHIAIIFESGIRAGRFHPIAEPYILAVALDSLCNAFLFLWLENPEKHSYPENPDAILNIIFKGLV